MIVLHNDERRRLLDVPFPPRDSNDDTIEDLCDLCGDNPPDVLFVYILPFDDNYVVAAWVCEFCLLYHGGHRMRVALLLLEKELERILAVIEEIERLNDG